MTSIHNVGKVHPLIYNGFPYEQHLWTEAVRNPLKNQKNTIFSLNQCRYWSFLIWKRRIWKNPEMGKLIFSIEWSEAGALSKKEKEEIIATLKKRERGVFWIKTDAILQTQSWTKGQDLLLLFSQARVCSLAARQ